MIDLFKKFKNERMTESEKQVGFNQLQSFIINNPVQSPWYKNIRSKVISPFQNGLLLHHKMLASAFVVILLISVTGGTSIMANYTIPGDILYPVKINLNEKVETFTAFSPKAKANVEVGHLDQRLSEAEELSIENRLDKTQTTQIENQFSQDLGNAMTHINTLKAVGDSDEAKKVKLDIENSLQKHKKVVDEIFQNKAERNSNTTSAKVEQKSIAPKIQMKEVEQDGEAVMMFNSLQAEIPTSTPETSEVKIESSNKISIENESDEHDKDTPLLNEILDKILYAESDSLD